MPEAPQLSPENEAVERNVSKAMKVLAEAATVAEKEEVMRRILRDVNRKLIAAQQRANEADKHVIAVCEQAETFLRYQEADDASSEAPTSSEFEHPLAPTQQQMRFVIPLFKTIMLMRF